jgi:diguanylate cyclase (GGDEF)-like protein
MAYGIFESISLCSQEDVGSGDVMANAVQPLENGRDAERRDISIDAVGQETNSSGRPIVESIDSLLHELLTTDGGSSFSVGCEVAGEQYDWLAQLSFCDPLTGLANRALCSDRLTQALARRRRDSGQVVVFHISLDQLRDVYEAHGQIAGDTTLRAVSSRLTSVLRSEDTLSRIGGFEIIGVFSIDEAEATAAVELRLRAAFSEPFEDAGISSQLRPDIRMALAAQGESAEHLMSRIVQEPIRDERQTAWR